MKFKLYFEDEKSTMGGWEIVPFYKLMWWIFIGGINVKEKSSIYFIRRIETFYGKRI